jgi:RimJ/RimL family protein N-acetyltransferase
MLKHYEGCERYDYYHFEIEGNLIGRVWLGKERLDPTYVVGVLIYVEERKKGYGTCLMQELIELAKSLGCHKLKLQVEENNKAAVRLYEKVGFKFINKDVDGTVREMEYHYD